MAKKATAPPGMQYAKNPSGKGWTLKPKAGTKPKGPKPLTPAQQAAEREKNRKANEEYAKAKAAYDAGPTTAYLTDPTYQQERADLDLDLNNARNTYESLMGTGGARGSIWQDYDHAVNALTRSNRSNIGQANAGLSGANLAGSGIARKQLSDIAAEFISDKSKLDTDRTRMESDATKAWQDQQTRYNASNLAGQQGAAFRWSQLNDAPSAPEKPKAVAPPGKQFVKSKNGQGWTAQPIKTTPKPVKQHTGTGTVKPGTKAPVPTKVTAPPGMKYVKQPGGKFKLKKV